MRHYGKGSLKDSPINDRRLEYYCNDVSKTRNNNVSQ